MKISTVAAVLVLVAEKRHHVVELALLVSLRLGRESDHHSALDVLEGF